MKKHFKVILEPDPEDGGFCIYVPDLPGCISQGETEEEALENIKDAIAMWWNSKEADVKAELDEHRDWVRSVDVSL